MPTYVYTCDACHMQFEKVQRFSDAPIQECPYCEEEAVRRVFQPVGVVFKGSGWYITDSRATSAAKNGTQEHADSTQKVTNGKKDGDVGSDKTSKSETSSSTEGTSSSTPAPAPTSPST